jgi:hypothetical protein
LKNLKKPVKRDKVISHSVLTAQTYFEGIEFTGDLFLSLVVLCLFSPCPFWVTEKTVLLVFSGFFITLYCD